MISPENAKARPAAAGRARRSSSRNSMREVQPEINLLVSPLPERLFVVEPAGAPQWELPAEETTRDRLVDDPGHDDLRVVGAAGPARRQRGRSGQEPGQGRLGPPVVAALHLRRRARSWTCRSSRSCPPGWTTGSRSGGAAKRYRDHRGTTAAEGRPTAPRAAGAATAAVPVAAEGRAHVARRAPTSASRRGCSRSGCAAPAATSSGHCRGSATPTPTRSGPTWPRFEHVSCPGRGLTKGKTPERRARPGAARPCLPATCWPAPTATWTSSRTRCGSTAADPARKRRSPDLKMIDTQHRSRRRAPIIVCERCRQRRSMSEAQGASGQAQAPRLPWPAPAPERLRQRLRAADHPDDDGCLEPMVRLHPVDHRDATHREQDKIALADRLRTLLTEEELTEYVGPAQDAPCPCSKPKCDLTDVPDEELTAAAAEALAPPPSEEDRKEKLRQLGSGRTARPGMGLPAEAQLVRAAAGRQRTHGHRDADAAPTCRSRSSGSSR